MDSEIKETLERLNKERPIIDKLLLEAYAKANDLQETIGELSWHLDGYYRAELYVRKMASNDLDSCVYWLNEADEQIKQWKADHEA